MKRILSIQDISCIGKCSNTVALPIISAMGIETAVLPTAVLSTHTAFDGFTFHDLTDDIEPICNHWKTQNITFDAIYTGYLGSYRQIDLSIKIFKDFGDKKIKFVDPAMGDNGILYPGFDRDFALKMFDLCRAGDIAVPNLTEACYMLGMPYRDSGYDEDYLKEILKKLAVGSCRKVLITGVSLHPSKLGFYGYDKDEDRFFLYENDIVGGKYHGTGDVFASVCVGGIIKGKTIEQSGIMAADFVCDSIRATVDDENPIKYGVHFEKVLHKLF